MQRFRTKTVIVLWCLILIPAGILIAQDNLPSVAEVQRAYDTLKFEQAAALGRKALQHSEHYSPSELVQLHLLMGYLSFIQDQKLASRRHFESALSLQPDLTLDSLLVSPKIVRWYEEVKNEFRVGLSSGQPAVKYILVEDHRLAALRRSASCVPPVAGTVGVTNSTADDASRRSENLLPTNASGPSVTTGLRHA